MNKNEQQKHRYKHIKSGGIYILICEALKEDNQEKYIVYQSEETNIVWARPKVEFDEKFVRLIDE
jgi:hypothetical protein